MASTTEKPDAANAVARANQQGGFFRMFKPGQGYWTRLGTAAASAILVGFTAKFLWDATPAWFNVGSGADALKWRLIIITPFVIACAVLVWWLMNAPKRAQFLIDTDAEMKKVNWSSFNDLVGSTRIVIVFMLAIAAILFAYDVVYSVFFNQIGLLKTSVIDVFFGGGSGSGS